MLSIRKIGVVGRTYRHFNRYRQILTILFRYGFGNFVDSLKIDQYIEIGLQMVSRKRRERVDRLSQAERVRMIFEELGPTFIKFGQVLSTRPDLVPVNYIDELSKLQNEVPSFSFEEVERLIQSEFEKSREDIFDSVDEKPLASASIGQVHRARLKNGEGVAVKFQRPGIRRIIEVDLEIMLHLATLMEDHVEGAAFYRPVKMVEEFANTLDKELDYTLEASSMERVARQFLGEASIYIPKVFSDYTTHKILTMEFIDGIKVSDIQKLDAAGIDRTLVTKNGADFLFRQIFVDGFFHADLHPGNLFILPGNVICPIDFGMMGFVDLRTREVFVELIDSIVHQNASSASRLLLDLNDYDEEPDLRSLERDLSDFMGRHLSGSLKNLNMGRLLQDVLDVASKHRLRLYPDTFLMMKSFAAVEGVALLLCPEFDMVAQAAPFIKKAKLARFSPKRVTEDIISISSGSLKFLQQFPLEFLEVTRMLRQRKLTVGFDIQGLDKMIASHNQISNRLSFSIIIAALIMGSALILSFKVPPLIFGVSLVGIAGFLAAAMMGIWLLVAIIKKGKL